MPTVCYNEGTVIGTILDGRYRILRLLGSGGMGEVYLGEHLELGRHEAIKILKSKLARDRDHLARFRREARATNRVQHENIVSFYDFGRLEDGRLYLTMEFADGPNLDVVLEREGRLEKGRAVSILRQLCLAVDFAHSKGVIHRDLKPQNLVLVQPPGRPDTLKVLDFGVAKITAEGYLESVAITKEGQLFGTPAYIAPEQIRGVTDDPRTDLYAIGCIAYALLTGETPFVGRPMAVIEAHVSDQPEPPSRRCVEAEIPGQLDRIVLGCLEKNPDLRVQSGAELAELFASLRLDGKATVAVQGLGHETLSGFAGDATIRGLPSHLAPSDDDGRSTDVFASRYDVQLRRVTKALAESICDQGCSDPMLLVLLAEVSQLEQELEALKDQLAYLVRSDQLVSQKGREREASLRFALGELKFERSSVGKNAEMDAAIEVLSHQLSDYAEHTRLQHDSIMDKQISRTADRAHKLEALKVAHEKLTNLVNRHAGSIVDNDQIVFLLEERQRICDLIEFET